MEKSRLEKNKWISILLCFFLGILGAHKFYEGRVLFGVLYALTGGLLGVGVIVDLIVLIFKPNPYFP
jgi:TM2 domain-containing membrane protein YozV